MLATGTGTAGRGIAVDRRCNLVVVGNQPGARGDGYVLKIWYPTNVAVRVTTPLNGTGQSTQMPVVIEAEVTGIDSTDAIQDVDFYAGKLLIGSSTNAPYRVTWTNTIAGAYELSAWAHTSAGATGISAPVTLLLTNQADPCVYYAFALLNDAYLGLSSAAMNNRGQTVGTAFHPGRGSFSTIFQWDQIGFRETLASMWTYYTATSINDLGEITGYSRSAGSEWEFVDGLLLTAQGPVDLGPGYVHKVNNLGQAVGGTPIDGHYVWNIKPMYVGYLWETGRVTRLGTLANESESIACSINNLGQIVGVAGSRAFLWTNGIITDLNTLISADSGWQLASATDINDAGQIIGAGIHNKMVGGYRWQAGEVTDLGAGQGGVYLATAINAHGQVVGSSVTAHAVLWQGGRWVDLNACLPADKDWWVSNAQDINDLGQILCWGSAAGLGTSFVLTPHRALSFLPQECGRRADGGFQLAFEGLPHASSILEASTDLQQWTVLTLVEPTAGSAVYLDQQGARSPDSGQRFYRLRAAR
jgi:probable HAF family extracellular repeat protein